MNMPDIYEVAVMALASGRVSYSLTNDSIFRPVREAVWRWSAPEHAVNSEGQPWRMLHSYKTNEFERSKGQPRIDYEFDPTTLRKVGFFGEIWSCIYCMSFWVAFAVIAAWILFGAAIIPWLTLPALWALGTAYGHWISS